jgi:rhodanese-related sulfurtransferase
VLQGVAPGEFRTKTAAASIPGLVRPVPPITPRDLQDKLRAGEVSLIDLATSLQYRKAHIDGAQWAIRARLDANLARIDLTRPVVMTSPDGRLAQLAAQDMRELSAANIFALEGGTHAWIAAGLPTTSGEGQMLDAPEDIWYRPYDRKDSVENSMRDYLSWEVELIEQIKREGVRYPVFPPE